MSRFLIGDHGEPDPQSHGYSFPKMQVSSMTSALKIITMQHRDTKIMFLGKTLAFGFLWFPMGAGMTFPLYIGVGKLPVVGDG